MSKFKAFYIFIICLSLIGCSTKQENTIKQENMTISSQEIGNSEEVDEQSIKISELQNVIDRQEKIIEEKSNNISELEDKLNEKSLDKVGQVIRIFDANFAPNGKYISVILITDKGVRFAYLCNIETEHSKFIDSRVAAQTYWSPDSKYFILDEGTGRSRWGGIYLTEPCELIDSLRYRGVLYWINSKEFIYVEENNDIKINSGTELEFTTNIIRYDVETKERKTLFEGNLDYYFYIDEVNENGSFDVSKNYIGNSSHDKDIEYIHSTSD